MPCGTRECLEGLTAPPNTPLTNSLRNTPMIDWLVQTAAPGSGLARGIAPAGLLAPVEQERLDGLRSDKRRRDWLLGRWTAKRLLQRSLAVRTGDTLPLDALTVLSTPDGAPLTLLAGRSAPALSISHSRDRALCALSWWPGLALGADIEAVEPRAPVFVADYFNPTERALIERAPTTLHDTLITTVWSAKEAALKALRLGLTVDTRSITCLPGQVACPTTRSNSPAPRGADSAHWLPLTITCAPDLAGGVWNGWWRLDQGFVLTIACYVT